MLDNLKAATFEVLETMFFLFPESLEEVNSFFRGPGFKAWVPIQGPKNFRVGMTVSQRLAREMAANFLGVAPEDLSLDQVEDAIREGTNMLAGNFLAREKVPGAFHLATPQSLRLSLDPKEWRPAPNHLLFAVDDQGLEVFLERGL